MNAPAPLFSLAGEVAVVTGAASGIGLATARRLAQAGARVVLADIADASEAAAELGGIYQACDVSSDAAVEAALQLAVERFGRLDVLVNNAGVFAGYATLAEKQASDYERCFRINVLGVAHGLRAAARLMQDGGRIVNLASAAGLIGVPGLADYVASKHAVVGLTKTAALELAARQIRVNCVCPASVNTPMAHADGGEALLEAERRLVPLGRICEPEEVAALIHFLVSKDCGFINGQAVLLDGGMSAGIGEQLYAQLASA